MNDQLYFRNVPAFSYPFIELPQPELDFLLSNTRFVLDRLERAKKGAIVLDHFQKRLRDKQVVRCTPQSVKVTAAARFAPKPEDLNLSNISTALFVNLITYLPLPEIRVLAGNYDALYEASKVSVIGDVDQRWGTYYTCLGAVNKEWAQLFFNEIQTELASRDRTTDPHTDIEMGNWIELENIPESVEHIIPHDNTDIAAEPSEDTNTNTGHRQMGPSDHEIITTTAHMEHTAHATDDPWQRETHRTEEDSELLQFQQEETLYIRLLRAKEKAWGLDHFTTLDTARKLGEFYAENGKMDQAEAMYLRVFQASRERGEKNQQES